MDEQALVRRMMALPITVASAKRLFPGTPSGSFFEAAPFDGRGRFLTFGRAFQIARECATQEAQEGRAAIAAATRAADEEQARAAVAAPAVAYLAGAVEREVEALSGRLRARSASPRAVAMIEGVGAVNVRQINRVRSRMARGAEHGEA